MMTLPLSIAADNTLHNRTPWSAIPQDGPNTLFGLIDILDGDETRWLLSDGSGRYSQSRPFVPLPNLLFIVEKRYSAQNIVVDLLSPYLREIIGDVLGLVYQPSTEFLVDIEQLVAQYAAVKERINELDQDEEHRCARSQLKALINGCILDQALFHGLHPGLLQRCKGLSHEYFQDMVHNGLQLGLDELDDCFKLGARPDRSISDGIEHINHRFKQLCFADQITPEAKLVSLQKYCEPWVRSGEFRVDHSLPLLQKLQRMGRGHAAVYEYVVDLVERTNPMNHITSQGQAHELTGFYPESFQHLGQPASEAAYQGGVSQISAGLASLRWAENRNSAENPVHPAPILAIATADHEVPGTNAADFWVVQYSSAQGRRTQRGRALYEAMMGACERFREHLQYSHWEYGTTGISSLISATKSWEAGLAGIRNILNNRLPSTGVEVLQVLLVAEILDADQDPMIFRSKSEDHVVWKATLGQDDQSLVDRLGYLITTRPIASTDPEMSLDELTRAQQVGQTVVSLGSPRGSASTPNSLRGLRLQQIYGTLTSGQAVNHDLDFTLPLGSDDKLQANFSPRVSMYDLEMSDLIDLDALYGKSATNDYGPLDQVPTSVPWKDVDPSVVLLLATWEFSAIIRVINSLQKSPSPKQDRTSVSLLSTGQSASHSRLDPLEELCCFGERTQDTTILDWDLSSSSTEFYISLIPSMKAWMTEGQDGLVSASLDPSFLQAVMEVDASFQDPKPLNTAALSRSLPLPIEDARGDRSRCQCSACGKTFSNISNRNKHTREGCAMREKKGLWPCSNFGCGKHLSTKWYRDRHEQTFCRFKATPAG